jgi:GNAT superfamily N-acetyltransferase
MEIGAEEAARLQRRSLARFVRMLVAGAGDSRLFERRGVAASICPSVPSHSIPNSVTYHDAADLEDALGDLATAYAHAGVAAWTVWAPADDEPAIAALTAAGHTLDGSPAAMSISLEDFEPPDVGDLDWDDQAEAAEVGTINDRAYGWADGGVATCIRDLKAGPSTRLYRARVEGQVASVAVVADTDDEASLFFVATDPEHQGQGLSTRLAGAALAAARDRGMRTSSLQASSDGQPVYDRLGYGFYGQIGMWEQSGS